MDNLRFCVEHGIHAVVGTTGFDDERLAHGARLAGRRARRRRPRRAQLRDRRGADDAVRRAGGPVLRVGRDRRAAPPGQGRRARAAPRAVRPSWSPRPRRDAGLGPMPDATATALRRRPRRRRRRRAACTRCGPRGLVAHQEVLLGDDGGDADDPARLLRPRVVHAGRAARRPRGRVAARAHRRPGAPARGPYPRRGPLLRRPPARPAAAQHRPGGGDAARRRPDRLSHRLLLRARLPAGQHRPGRSGSAGSGTWTTSHHFTLVCADFAQLGQLVQLDNAAFRAIKAATPGPYTFILPATREVPQAAGAPEEEDGGRADPGPPGRPGAAARARRAAAVQHPAAARRRGADDRRLADQGGARPPVDAVVDAGDCGTEPTTVVDWSEGFPEVVRVGAGDPAGSSSGQPTRAQVPAISALRARTIASTMRCRRGRCSVM